MYTAQALWTLRARGPRRHRARLRERDLPRSCSRSSRAPGVERARAARARAADLAGRARRSTGSRSRGGMGVPGRRATTAGRARTRARRRARRAGPAPRRDGRSGDRRARAQRARRPHARGSGTTTRRSGSRPAAPRGAAARRTGACGTCPRRTSTSCPTSAASTSSTSAAAPATGARGSPASARAPSGSTSPRPSSRPRASCRPSTGIEFPLVHASAEAPPFEDRSFDLVFSEYGAAIWCDPSVWIPQAFRLLRPGGRLIFLRNSVLAMLTAPRERRARAARRCCARSSACTASTGRTPARSNFHLPHGAMLRLLRDTGFEVEALHELRAPEGDDDEVPLLRPPRLGAAVAVRGGLGGAAARRVAATSPPPAPTSPSGR